MARPTVMTRRHAIMRPQTELEHAAMNAAGQCMVSK
jgi:hypothetical protein